jgi:hypothetical protein
VRKSLLLAVICILGASGCSGIHNQGPNKFNDVAVLSGNLPYNPLQWSVVTAGVSRKEAIVYTIFGNREAVSYARSGAEGNYPIGAILSLVTWTQRPSPRWFGGMIPGAVRTVEFASVVSDDHHRPEYVYEEYQGSPLTVVTSQRETTTTPTGRLAYLLAQRGALLP